MFIETKELKKTFRTDAGEIQVLKGIDLSIEVGEMVGIVGASGVGKSTLLHILGVLDEPTSGKVFYNAVDVFSLTEIHCPHSGIKPSGLSFSSITLCRNSPLLKML